MIRALLNKFPGWRWRPRIIRRNAHETPPYLTRWYLTRMPSVPDGSFPYSVEGHPKPGITGDDSSYSLFLHKFGQDDKDADPHNHPWAWAVSLILKGGYIEERYDSRTGKSAFIPRPAPCINFIKHSDYHRVALVNGEPAWSLFFTGPQVSSWGFIDRKTRKFMFWQEYFGKHSNGTAKTVRDADWHLELGEEKF